MVKDNVIQFPISKRMKDKVRDDAFQFHKERINKLLHELQYEFFRAYENPELQGEEFVSRAYLPVTNYEVERIIELRVYERKRPKFPKISIHDTFDPEKTD